MPGRATSGSQAKVKVKGREEPEETGGLLIEAVPLYNLLLGKPSYNELSE
ncbi:hypothetical protein GNI_042050, partial [Gregarina niphandrodes]